MHLSPDERQLSPAQQLDYATFFQSPALVQRPGSLAPQVVADMRPEQLLSQELLEHESQSWDSQDYKANSLTELTVKVGAEVQTWYLITHIGAGLGPAQFAAVYDREAPARAAYAFLVDHDYNTELVATTVQEMVAAAQQPHMQN